MFKTMKSLSQTPLLLISVLSQTAALTLAVMTPTWIAVGLVLVTLAMTAYVSWINRHVNQDLEQVKSELKIIQDKLSAFSIMTIGGM